MRYASATSSVRSHSCCLASTMTSLLTRIRSMRPLVVFLCCVHFSLGFLTSQKVDRHHLSQCRFGTPALANLRQKSVLPLDSPLYMVVKDNASTGGEKSRRVGPLKTLALHRRHKHKSPSATAATDVRGDSEPDRRYQVKTREELDAFFNDEEDRFRDSKGSIDYDTLLKSLVVTGDTQVIGSKNHPERIHPVLKVLHDRRRNNSTCVEGTRPDGMRVALAIEGGGMRGCISAGMVAAVYYLGLEESIDVVYGSSAGTVIGSYFITRQLQWMGPEIYYDSLTMAGKKFIDTKRLLRAIGFGLLDPRLVKDVVSRRGHGKPVLNLDFLLRQTVQESKRLDWEKFTEMQKVQPLKVVASGLKSEKAVVMDYETGHFRTLDELTRCQHASCLLPGIAGPVMNMNMASVNSEPAAGFQSEEKFILGNGLDKEAYEPMADALLYEPMPYHSAVNEGATHVIVFRTRPDGADVTGKTSIFERLILKRFFTRKNKLPNMYRRMRMHLHKKRYAEDVIELNEAAWDDRDPYDISSPHLLPIAVPPGSPEVPRLETGRAAIFDGVRRGFARAYDALVEDPSERGMGIVRAKEYFPDDILNYDPLDFASHGSSAFEAFRSHEGGQAEKSASGAVISPADTR